MAKREFRWMIIRIPIINLIFVGILLLLVVSVILFAIFSSGYMNNRHTNHAQDTLEEARILMTHAVEKQIPERQLSPIVTLISKSEHFLDAKLPREAVGPAEDAVQQLQYLLASFQPNTNLIEGRYARISEIHGTVEMLPPGSSDWIIADLNQVLRRGTRMRTQRSSTAKLKFDDGSTIQMKENSLVIIRELSEDETTQAKSSNIELGTSHIEALIKESRMSGSSFRITMPDNSEAEIKSESSLEVKVDGKKKSVVKVFMGRVEVIQGDQRVALTSREAVILDSRDTRRKRTLKTIAIPLPPRLMYPANVQLLTVTNPDTDSIFFRWTLVQDVKKYTIDISKDYYFYELSLSNDSDTNRFSTSHLDPGNYYWRVNSVNQAGLASEPSPFNSFRIVLAGDLDDEQKDLAPPIIEIERVTLLGHIVDISGRTEPAASLYVNEQRESVREDGTFRVLVEFKQSGLQIIFIESYDSVGNMSTVRREITIPNS